MIDVPKFTKAVTAAFRSKTKEELDDHARAAMAAFLAGVKDALEVANDNDSDKLQIRQLLSEAKTSLNRIDLDGLHVATKAKREALKIDTKLKGF